MSRPPMELRPEALDSGSGGEICKSFPRDGKTEGIWAWGFWGSVPVFYAIMPDRVQQKMRLPIQEMKRF